MKKVLNLVKFWMVIFLFINLSCITTTKDVQYRDALQEARTGNIDFAFMKLNNYLREFPTSIHTQEIRFAVAEYYFQTGNYRDAISTLSKYIIDYPKENNTVFVQAILYKILLKYTDEPLLLEKLKETFFSKSIFLIFSDSKTKYYNSILNNRYKIVDYVDRIEVFKNGEKFLKITP